MPAKILAADIAGPYTIMRSLQARLINFPSDFRGFQLLRLLQKLAFLEKIWNRSNKLYFGTKPTASNFTDSQ